MFLNRQNRKHFCYSNSKAATENCTFQFEIAQTTAGHNLLFHWLRFIGLASRFQSDLF